MTQPATHIHVNGIVQGVGFRPFVYRLARQLNLAGYITNSGNGVVITVAGTGRDIETLVRSLRNNAPPLARIVSIDQQPTTLPDETTTFTIMASDAGPARDTHVSPDVAACSDCLREITDPADRRSQYPFTNCTNCGPRYTIIRSLPYDRPRTTMDVFPMCPDCRAEYNNPMDRRFHAQPNACPECGPRLEWRDSGEETPDADAPLDKAVQALAQGQIIGVKGLGGFHLAADASSFEAVAKLRERKRRPAKPLAVMARDLDTAKRLCDVTEAEEEQLTSIQSPIVLLRKKAGTGLAANLAPHIGELGVMLPYTPLHALLFAHPQAPDCLVMTSGNAAGEPLCKDNEEALDRLASFCDGFLLHNREIHTRVDDSVVRLIDCTPRFLRRARGYAPSPVRLTENIAPILAVGGELKNCFCLARGRDAFMSQHIGDMNNLAALEFFEQTYERLARLLEIEPQAVCADLHPDYLSARFAASLGLPIIKAQHHWAHAASVMAEHGLEECLAVILDGTGYGPDNTIWGGEVLRCTFRGYERLGRISPLPMPGGDKAALQPWRMALAALHVAGMDESAFPGLQSVGEKDKRFIRDMLEKDVHCPLTSSCGRLFDAVSALLGICQHNTFEGQAAMELEAAAAKELGNRSLLATGSVAEFEKNRLFAGNNGLPELSTSDLIRLFTEKMRSKHLTVPQLALFFHQFLVAGFGNMIGCLSRQSGITQVVLSGGCMQNNILTQGFIDYFKQTRLKLYANVQVPANDGGLALGQAVIGGAHVPGNTHAGE